MNKSTATHIVNEYNASFVEGDAAGNRKVLEAIFSDYPDEDLLEFVNCLNPEQRADMAIAVVSFISSREPYVRVRRHSVKKVLNGVKNSPQHIIVPVATAAGNLVARHAYKKSLRAHMAMKGREIQAVKKMKEEVK